MAVTTDVRWCNDDGWVTVGDPCFAGAFTGGTADQSAIFRMTFATLDVSIPNRVAASMTGGAPDGK